MNFYPISLLSLTFKLHLGCNFVCGAVMFDKSDAVVVDYTSALGRFDGSHLGWQFVPCPNNEAASSTSTFSRINDPPTHGALAKKAAEENGNGGGNGNDCDAALSGVGGSKDKKVEDDTAAALVAPVSWNPGQRFYVYQKVPCVSGDQ